MAIPSVLCYSSANIIFISLAAPQSGGPRVRPRLFFRFNNLFVFWKNKRDRTAQLKKSPPPSSVSASESSHQSKSRLKFLIVIHGTAAITRPKTTGEKEKTRFRRTRQKANLFFLEITGHFSLGFSFVIHIIRSVALSFLIAKWSIYSFREDSVFFNAVVNVVLYKLIRYVLKTSIDYEI